MSRLNLPKPRLLIGAGLVVGIGVFFLIFSITDVQPGYRGVLIDPPQPAEDFTLQTDQGEIHLSDYRGKVVLLYFGYTFCPDVCPTTLAKISQATKDLEKNASKVQTIFISVDPERDTLQNLGKYSRAFSPDFIGATGTPEGIAAIAKQYGIYYEKKPLASGAGYSIDHTAIVWVIDPRGNLRLEWPYGFESADMVSDLKKLFKQ